MEWGEMREWAEAPADALVEDQQRYRSLFTHTPHAAFSIDLEGGYLAVNPASCEMLGYTEAEFLTLKNLLATARRSGAKLMRLVEDLLDFSGLATGSVQLHPQPFVVRETVGSALGEVAAATAAQGLQLSMEVAADVPAELIGDDGRIGQVLTNLLNNAVKFTDAGSVSLLVDLGDAADGTDARADAADDVAVDDGAEETGGRPDGIDLRLRIVDTGIGIAPEQVEELFEPFIQGDASTTRRFAGAGLGLAICRELIDLMDGSIRIESEPGTGTTVAVVVPLTVP